MNVAVNESLKEHIP